MSLIILIRHAEREYIEGRADAEQVLTDYGRETALRLGNKLAARLEAENRQVATLLTSPYVRAYQTAQIVAPLLGFKADIIQNIAALATEPDGSVSASLPTVLEASHQGVVVFGHSPELAEICNRLTGYPLELKKANALAIDWNPDSKQGRVIWHLSHK